MEAFFDSRLPFYVPPETKSKCRAFSTIIWEFPGRKVLKNRCAKNSNTLVSVFRGFTISQVSIKDMLVMFRK